MKNLNCARRVPAILALLVIALSVQTPSSAQTHPSTRITDPQQHHRQGDKRYPYRAKSDYILQELDLRKGDVVLDVGAGDGWWSEKFAEQVGEQGMVFAAEIAEAKVDRMSKRFAELKQIRPRLIDTDNTGLPVDSCDVAFFSQSYHHLDEDGHIKYLKHLRDVIKPTGRVAIIEKYTETGLGSGTHGTRMSRLVRQAEKAGWVPVRVELMTGTYHYLAILAQQDLFPPEPERQPQAADSTPKQESNLAGKTHTPDSLELVQQRLTDKSAILIDVREQAEWDAGHLAQAVLVPLSELRNGSENPELGKQLGKLLPQDKIIYCHCRSGGRVLLAGPILAKLGYDIRPLKAGYNDLLEAGFAPGDAGTNQPTLGQ